MITSLPFGHEVEVTGDAQVPGWKSVNTEINGGNLSGFVSGKHLRPPVSSRKEALIAEAAAQWQRFDRGQGPEEVDPYAGFVGEMWHAIGWNRDGRDRSDPWSAAFISFIARRAGYDDFAFSAAHATYIHDAITKRQAGRDASFWGFRLNEHSPALGDLVCRNRSNGTINFARAAADDGFISHCDLVIQVGDGFINVVGGNVGDSVRTRQCQIDDDGRIIGPSTVFAVLRNNR
ncbi:MAG: DUF2272 domain-containing protein [Geminicoccaceae bacterium]